MTRLGRFGFVVCHALALPVAAQSIHYEGGVSVSSGRYIFTERTTSWTVATGVAVSAGPFTFRGTLPVYVQNSSLISGSAIGLMPTGGAHSGAVRDSSAARGGQRKGSGPDAHTVGTQNSSYLEAHQSPVEVPTTAVTGFAAMVGDPTVTVSASTNRRTSLTMSVGVKIPATDTASFGTGEWDFGGTVGVSRFLGNSMLLSADLSYWHLGDPPALDVTDPLMASVGLAYLSLSGWAASFAFSGARSIIEGFADAYFLNGGLTRVWSRSAVGVSTSVGFTESTPDFTIGVNWRIRLMNN